MKKKHIDIIANALEYHRNYGWNMCQERREHKAFIALIEAHFDIKLIPHTDNIGRDAPKVRLTPKVR